MKPTTRTLAVSLLAGAFLFSVEAANAQTNSPPQQPRRGRPSSLRSKAPFPSNAPPATTTQTTGEAPRDPNVKQMNEKEKDKVEREGK